MREIKFRAWDKNRKICWPVIEFKFAKEPENHWVWVYDGGDSPIYGLGPQQYELMQYTGLKDKNGKEIYEGDIVISPTESHIKIMAKVVWDDNCARFQLDSGSPMMNFIYTANINSLEVIGNIYENPELL